MSFILAALAILEVVPREAPFPAGFDPAKPWRLVEVDGGGEVPAQAREGRLYWMGRPGAAVRLEAAAPGVADAVDVSDDGTSLEVRHKGRKLLRYAHRIVEPPAGKAAVFRRSGYLHPVWTPAGRVATNDFPPNHLHHHGIWGAWTSGEFEGKKTDFWNSIQKQGTVECVKVEETWSGPVFGGFRARHRHTSLVAPGGPKPALDEVWEVRIWAVPDDQGTLFDVISTQTCAGPSPLLIREFRYGGLGFRGSGQWEGKDGCAFLTSEGKGRVDGHGTRAAWCVMSGKVDGSGVSVGFLGHPSNFRHPQPMRIHPDEPFFNWAVPQAGDFSIEPGTPYVARYRFLVADGALDAPRMALHAAAYADPAGRVEGR
jgi:hypothetical protein